MWTWYSGPRVQSDIGVCGHREDYDGLHWVLSRKFIFMSELEGIVCDHIYHFDYHIKKIRLHVEHMHGAILLKGPGENYCIHAGRGVLINSRLDY